MVIGSTKIIDESGEINEQLLKDLKCLYSTVEGTCPMDRDFGLSIEPADKPYQIAINLFTRDVIEKTEKYIPQITVEDVLYEVKENKLKPIVKITINEDYEEEESEEE